MKDDPKRKRLNIILVRKSAPDQPDMTLEQQRAAIQQIHLQNIKYRTIRRDGGGAK